MLHTHLNKRFNILRYFKYLISNVINKLIWMKFVKSLCAMILKFFIRSVNSPRINDSSYDIA